MERNKRVKKRLIPTICAASAHLFLRGGPPRTAPGASPAAHQKPHSPNGGHSQDHNPGAWNKSKQRIPRFFHCRRNRLKPAGTSIVAIPHGYINFTDTEAKCRFLKRLTYKGTLQQVYIRVYRLEIQSVMLVFRPSFLNCCPCNLLSGSSPPLHPLPF